MKNVLVPISVRLDNFTEDTITVALLAFNEQVKFYEFSLEKLKIARSILGENSMVYLEGALKSLKNSFVEESKKKELTFTDNLFSEKYIDYLSKYSRGLIRIGEPKGFAMELNEASFHRAFKSFVGADLGKTSPKADASLRSNMREVLKNEAFKKVDVLYSVKPSLISGIYASHKVDFIGVNGSPYAGLAVDFTKDEAEVDKTILTFRSIANGIKEKAKVIGMSEGKYELNFNDPESIDNKKLLDRVRKDSAKGFDMVEFGKVNIVIKNLERGNYFKFSESKLAVSK